MTDNPSSALQTDIFDHLPEAEALRVIGKVADSRWKISQCFAIMDKMASQLEAAPMTPPIDYQILEEALEWLETLFRQEDRTGRFAPEIARLGIEVQEIRNQNHELYLAWRTLALELQNLWRHILRALYYRVPTLKKEIDLISSRLRTTGEVEIDLVTPPSQTAAEDEEIGEFSKLL